VSAAPGAGPAGAGPELWAWPIYPLDGAGGVLRGPAGWELTLGPIGDHGRPYRRTSLPSPPTGTSLARAVWRAVAGLGPFVVLPWAVRSYDDGEVLLAALAAARVATPAEIAVPIVPAGYTVEASRRLAAAGFRRAAAGEPYLHRSAVDRLSLGPGDLVLLAPVPARARPAWLTEMAALGRERLSTVARGVSDRRLAAELVAAGVTHADGTAIAPPLRVRLAPDRT
jgi:hypothetical protein